MKMNEVGVFKIVEDGMKNLKKKVLPPERFELSTPGLQDQCSNP